MLLCQVAGDKDRLVQRSNFDRHVRYLGAKGPGSVFVNGGYEFQVDFTALLYRLLHHSRRRIGFATETGNFELDLRATDSCSNTE